MDDVRILKGWTKKEREELEEAKVIKLMMKDIGFVLKLSYTATR